MKKLNCLSIQEKENTRLIYRKKTILGKAEYHNRVRSRLPVPELGLLLSMGAGEAKGGRKPPASCPSPPAPNTREATGPNP
jgi:hypothetical protein